MDDTVCRHAALALAFTLAPVALQSLNAQQPLNPPLKNWASPLYWHPNQAEREASARLLPELKFSTNQISNDALTFVAITPCRLVDTRGAAAGFIGVTPFNGPGVPAGGGNLTFPVQSSAQTSTTAPAPCGAIPSFAAAYSINLTVVPVAGGAVDNVSLWPSGSTQPIVATLNDPQGIIAQNAAIVPAGTPFGGFSFHSTGPAATDIVIDMNGYYSAPSDLNLNTAIGFGALGNNSTGTNNAAFGAGALQANSTGLSNTASGVDALFNNSTGSFNTASGANALAQNTTGSQNTASGYLALQQNSTGNLNTAIGQGALQDNTTGGGNTASGAYALESNTTGGLNTASGWQALSSNTTGWYNTASGFAALANNTTAFSNTATGYQALEFNTTGCCNTASGQAALLSNTTGTNNTASGLVALVHNTTGSDNTASGADALFSNTTGNDNTASGYGALFSNTIGVSNTALGYQALYSNSTGQENTAVGYQALQNNTSAGGGNTAVGVQALQNNTGYGNIAIGGSAGYLNTSGSDNIYIGSSGLSGDYNGTISIGDPVNSSFFFVQGVYARNASGGVPVYINSNGQLGTVSSSARFKEQITDMGDSSSKLFQLRPVSFFYKPEYDDGSRLLQYGLIAEEVAKVYPEMVAYDKDGQILTVKYQLLAPMLLNEVQKQNAQLQKQQEENRKLEERLAALETLLSSQTAAAARRAGSQ